MEAVSRYLTLAEIAVIFEMPAGTVRWLAHRDRWKRTEDGRRPVLYLRDDVKRTMSAVLQARAEAKAAADALRASLTA